MSSAKAQLESDTKVLAWEAGRKYGIRINTISAGPLASRAAIAIKKVRRRRPLPPPHARARARARKERGASARKGIHRAIRPSSLRPPAFWQRRPEKMAAGRTAHGAPALATDPCSGQGSRSSPLAQPASPAPAPAPRASPPSPRASCGVDSDSRISSAAELPALPPLPSPSPRRPGE